MNVRFVGADYRCGKDFHICRPNGSGNYLFVMFKTPSVVHIKGDVLLAGPNIFILYEKGKPQDYRTYGDVFNHDFVEFDYSEQSELPLLGQIPLNTLIKAGNPQIITDSVRQLSCEYFSNSKYRQAILNHLCQVFLLKVKEQAEGGFQSEMSNRFYSALLSIRNDIYHNPQADWTVDIMAKKIPLSPSYFQMLYKQSFGISCINDVIAARMNLAKQYLLYTDGTVSQIAHICGYRNDVHFMRQFKAQTAMTPKEYRKCTNI